MSTTSIEWCDRVINICRGCDAISPGCLNCYAARMATRFSAAGDAYDGLAVMKAQPPDRQGRKRHMLAVWTNEPVMLVPDAMLEALTLRKPCKVFVCSMSDLFHADVPFEYIAAWWAFMACSPSVTYQIVTKRAERMPEFFAWTAANGGPDHWLRCAFELCLRRIAETAGDAKVNAKWMKAPATLLTRFKAVTAEAEVTRNTTLLALPNVWLMVSTENQETFDERVPHLLACPAVVHGISAEPLLGPLDLRSYLRPTLLGRGAPSTYSASETTVARVNTLRWVIPGGESGPGARPCEVEWIRDIRWQIINANAAHLQHGGGALCAFFPKQLGSCAVDSKNGLAGAALKVDPDFAELVTHRLKDSHGGDESEWPADLQGLRAFPVPARIAGPPDRPSGPCTPTPTSCSRATATGCARR